MSTDPLVTVAEQSAFTATGRTAEVERLCDAFARSWPDTVRCIEFGRSAEGRPMLALLISRRPPGQVPLLMVQAGIHPGESDGKDAGFIALRELLREEAAPGVLEQIAILFVPAFNVDGHERFGRWNRPNQNGPEQTGWRTTAQNLNLNRDYMKADAPEMRALLQLIGEWDPLVCADLHVTDGANFQPDVSIQVEPINQGDPRLWPAGLELRTALIEKLTARGSLPLPFYPDLARTDDPSSGFVLTVYSPRFSTGYFAQRNRFTVLVETHSWKPYARRIQVTRNTVVELAQLLALHGARWQGLVRQADLDAAGIGGTEVTLDYKCGWREPPKAGALSAEPRATGEQLIDFRGYAYRRERSAISGDLVTVYDPATPQIWRVPLRDEVESLLSVKAPRGGYLVPAAHAPEVAAKLALHGIRLEKLGAALTNIAVEVFRAERVTFSSAPFEGRMRTKLEGAWQRERTSLAAGALFAPIAQARARLLMALLEPKAPDSLAAWGFFNTCFEQKEQMEPYVAEQIAREMLAAQPALAAEFERRLEADPAFATDPSARLEFFLRRHASWDTRYNLYPILRVDELGAPGSAPPE
jgi:hypothetical protein